jgi:hypothetical protein
LPHNEENNNLYSSPSITGMITSEEDERGRACSMKGAKGNAYRILVGKSEEKRPLGKSRHRWEDNIKINIKHEVVCTGLIWLKIGTGGGSL